MLVMPRSGLVLDGATPSSDGVRLEDIACGLSTAPLFGPQAVFFYSLAQHAVDVMRAAQAAGVDGRALSAALHRNSATVYAFGHPEREAMWSHAIADVFGYKDILDSASLTGQLDTVEAAMRIDAAAVLLVDGGRTLAEESGLAPVGLTARGPKRRPVSPSEAERAFIQADTQL